MKATEQHFPVVLFVITHKLVLTFASVVRILNYCHSHGNYQALSAFHGCRGFSSLFIANLARKLKLPCSEPHPTL